MPVVVKTIADNPAEHPRDVTDRAFQVGLVLKALDGLLETAGGVFLFFISPDQINRLAQWLTHGELSEDPHDWIATHVLKSAHHFAASGLTFGAIYLLIHGVVKLVLVAEVWRDHLWAYIGLIVVTALFIIYQTYRMVDDFTFGMLALSIFDLIIIFLTVVEYRRQKHHLRLKHQSRPSSSGGE